MTIPETEPQYHHHEGVEFPVEVLSSYLQEPGEEPKWVEMGEFCPVCGFAESPAAARMHLEAIMGFAVTEVEVEPPEGFGDRRLSHSIPFP